MIVDPSPTDGVMADEIFGPILPVVTVDSLDSAAEFINSKPKPLALYLFTSSRLVAQAPSTGFRRAARSSTIRDALHGAQLPFGGVGASGMGAYHGRWGFEAMSHRRAVLAKRARPDLRVVYPPYSDGAMKIMRKVF